VQFVWLVVVIGILLIVGEVIVCVGLGKFRIGIQEQRIDLVIEPATISDIFEEGGHLISGLDSFSVRLLTDTTILVGIKRIEAPFGSVSTTVQAGVALAALLLTS